jgi:predicted transposase YdaD
LPEFPNPHDRFFKEVFGRQETARDFLANYLPPNAAEALDLLNLELVKDSFVDSKLREYFSDVLYHVGLKRGEGAFVYVLFEHKSAPDEWVAFQLLRYMVRIWEAELEKKVRKLIPIVPLVLYHGRRKSSAAVKSGLPQQEGWIMSTLAETWIKEGMKRGRREGIQKGIEQGIQRGIEQGIEHGIRRGKATVMVRQLQARLGNLDTRQRARIGRLPVESLEDLGIALLDFETRKDLTTWLREHAGK